MEYVIKKLAIARVCCLSSWSAFAETVGKFKYNNVGRVELTNKFTVINYSDGKSAHQVDGEVRTSPDGVKITAINFSYNTFLYEKVGNPVTFFIQQSSGKIKQCEISG